MTSSYLIYKEATACLYISEHLILISPKLKLLKTYPMTQRIYLVSFLEKYQTKRKHSKQTTVSYKIPLK